MKDVLEKSFLIFVFNTPVPVWWLPRSLCSDMLHHLASRQKLLVIRPRRSSSHPTCDTSPIVIKDKQAGAIVSENVQATTRHLQRANMEIIMTNISELEANLYQTKKEMNKLKKQGACLEDIEILEDKSLIEEIQDEIEVQTAALQQEAAPTV